MINSSNLKSLVFNKGALTDTLRVVQCAKGISPLNPLAFSNCNLSLGGDRFGYLPYVN